MTRRRWPRDVPASVRQRLLNLAHEREIRFNRLLERYTAERFLFRLSVSDVADHFTLKGAALFLVWTGQEMRPTRDVDFLSTGPEDHAAIRAALETVCATPCVEDGVTFDAGTMDIADIRADNPQTGVRARLQGRLGQARLDLQVDIGFGDAITPGRERQNFPTLLDLPVPRLWTSPRETMIAEKFNAMVSRDNTNSRVKDLWDIPCLARRFPFDGETLRSAIAATFRRQGTAFADRLPLPMLDDYYKDSVREARWQAMHRKMGPEADGPAKLVDASAELRRFLQPVWESLIDDRPFTMDWPGGGPWRSGTEATTGRGGRD